MPAALGLEEAITEADRAEFKIIQKMRVYDSKHHPYHSVNRYVADRTRYFGAPYAYAEFAMESDAELATTQWVGKKRTRTLKQLLEYNHKHESAQQKIFYRWVRKAYKRKYGKDENIPELIRKGMSEDLANRIAAVRGSVRVKSIHDEQFHAGGFNPRPIKFDKHYLLGTLSEHATGLAVDIDDTRNPQLTADEWAFIEKLAGKKVVRTGRWSQEADAEGLWKDIKALSDLFVDKVAAAVGRVEKERSEKEKAAQENAQKAGAKAASSSTAQPAKKISSLEEVLGKHFKSLAEWTSDGFFHLPLELVLELHAHGFTWGATFGSNVDLHHFQIDE
jgi:hypothetical protein